MSGEGSVGETWLVRVSVKEDMTGERKGMAGVGRE